MRVVDESLPFIHRSRGPKLVLRWNKRERALLKRAVVLLDEAREKVGPETEPGIELAKASVILDEFMGGVELER